MGRTKYHYYKQAKTQENAELADKKEAGKKAIRIILNHKGKIVTNICEMNKCYKNSYRDLYKTGRELNDKLRINKK